MRHPAVPTHVRPRMGTFLAVTMVPTSAEADRGYLETTFETATRCERLMSRHLPQSALNRLNRTAGAGLGLASPDLAHVLLKARELSRATEGAFDPTIGPVLAVWRDAARRRQRPPAWRLRTAVAAVDWRLIRINGSWVALPRDGMALDLGGFGKGVALDLIAERLQSNGCGNALLNFGESSLVAIGRPARGRWRIVLRHPRNGFVGEFPLTNRACSTSATVGCSTRIGRRRISHIVDPRTGHPLSSVAQVTVLASSAAVAEAVSTALLVLGRSAMEALATRLKIDACWIDDAGVFTTPWFPLRRLP